MTARDFQWQRNPPLLRKLISLSTIIISANFLIGIVLLVYDVEDEIGYLDTLWRAVSGQRVGIATTIRWDLAHINLAQCCGTGSGPHYNVMRLAIALFSLSIAFCGCIVAQRMFSRRADLALLFCVTLAFQLSEPTIFGNHIFIGDVGILPGRQIVAALAVLFLQTFSLGSRLS